MFAGLLIIHFRKRSDMETIEYQVDNHLASITLNRPEKMNAVNAKMRSELWAAFTDIRENRDVWAALITGRGKAFCAGHDLTEPFANAKPSFDELYALQTETYKPLISAVNGVCLAQGGALALSSDICIVSEQARFGWPQVKRGISSISGPTMLARRVQLNKAFEILFTGEFIDATAALKLGLINHVVPHDQLMAEAHAMVDRILENAPLAVQAMKEATVRTLSLPAAEAYKLAGQILESVEKTEDAQEGMRAFKEKCKPVWKAK